MMGYSMTPMVRNILIINVLLWVISIFCFAEFHVDLVQVLGLHYFRSERFEPYQIFTHMFMHSYIAADGIVFAHLFSNMFALFMFGPALENVWGAKRFLIYYMVCGLGAALIHSSVVYVDMRQMEVAKDAFISKPSVNNYLEFLHEIGVKDPKTVNALDKQSNDPTVIEDAKRVVLTSYNYIANVPMVGASGAVFGILLGFGMLFPNTVLMLLIPPIPIKAKYLVLIYGLLELYSGVHVIPGDNVAHFAHLGGMLFGFLLIKYWNNQRNSFY
jgi:membrane associated rhomboid family serine protease